MEDLTEREMWAVLAYKIGLEATAELIQEMAGAPGHYHVVGVKTPDDGPAAVRLRSFGLDCLEEATAHAESIRAEGFTVFLFKGVPMEEIGARRTAWHKTYKL